jgi:membrane associated rhomboid family serine protease
MLELEWGLARYASVYATSGVTSSLLSCVALPDTLGVG